MLNYLDYLTSHAGMPYGIGIALVILFQVMQVIGEILEFKGKVIVPEFMKIRKYFERKKQERELFAKVSKQLDENKELFREMMSHYSTDNINLRNVWMHDVDEDRTHIRLLEEILLKLKQEVVKLRIESMRSEIISFASRVANGNCLVTREEFHRIFRLYDDYEKILEENNMENGEIDINYQIIKKAYEKHLLNRTFIEDLHDPV